MFNLLENELHKIQIEINFLNLQDLQYLYVRICTFVRILFLYLKQSTRLDFVLITFLIMLNFYLRINYFLHIYKSVLNSIV